jgi:hypothetical protein
MRDDKPYIQYLFVPVCLMESLNMKYLMNELTVH